MDDEFGGDGSTQLAQCQAARFGRTLGIQPTPCLV